MRHVQSKLLALVAGLLFAASAAADITFDLGNNPQPDEENILFNGPGSISGPALTVVGITNDTGLPVFFTGIENLVTPAQGQARIEAQDGSFTDLTLGVQGGAFLDFILNPDILGSQDGTVTVTVTEVGGATSQFSFTGDAQGNNFLTIFATNGQSIQSIHMVSTAPIEFVDLSQPRISGAASCPEGSTNPVCLPPLRVPEPASLALIGIALLVMVGGVKLRRA